MNLCYNLTLFSVMSCITIVKLPEERPTWFEDHPMHTDEESPP